MSDDLDSPQNKEVVIAMFEGHHTAEDVIRQTKNTPSDMAKIVEHATVISMDEKGKVSVAGDHEKRKGTFSGTAVGLLLGTLLGLPIAGAVLGGVMGRFSVIRRQKKKAKESDEDVLQKLVNQLDPDSSLLIVEVEDWRSGDVSDSLQMKGAQTVVHIPVASLPPADPTG